MPRIVCLRSAALCALPHPVTAAPQFLPLSVPQAGQGLAQDALTLGVLLAILLAICTLPRRF